MRFARQAKIFRGPLDPAPVAGVLLLLIMFMLLSSLVYTPGVLVELGQPITITSSNEVLFAGKSYKPGELDQLRTDLKRLPTSEDVSIKMEPGAAPSLGRQVSNLFQITFPAGKNLAGTDNATVTVAVNFRGQCFFENQLVQDAQLKAKLAERLAVAARDARKLTLILWMDKSTEIQVKTHLEDLAREAGISSVLEAGQPPIFGGRP